MTSLETVPRFQEESRYSSASIAKRAAAKGEGRRHSFRVPGLPAIESNSAEDSENSQVPSLSTTPSAVSDETIDHRDGHQHLADRRESCDDRFSGYLLSLAARAAEKQLREQALMAAYPNEGAREHVDHFGVDSDEDSPMGEEGVGLLSRDSDGDYDMFSRRESVADGAGWELKEMRRHQEKLEIERQERKKEQEEGDQVKSFNHHFASSTPGHVRFADSTAEPKNIVGGWQKDVNMEPMRKSASPPMLGKDLKFVLSQSPKPTMFDVHHYPTPQKHAGEQSSGDGSQGLWGGSNRSRQNSGPGLWMGLCGKDTPQPGVGDSTTGPSRSGLMTPSFESDDPFDQIPIGGSTEPAFDTPGTTYPPSPVMTPRERSIPMLITPPEVQLHLPAGHGVSNIDELITREKDIEHEFNDTFVTQIYNYLSLGYPSLARPFDEELAKITNIAVPDLRKDDHSTNAKGYVGAPEGPGMTEECVKQGKCMRWTALKLYVHEWARQQPKMADGLMPPTQKWGDRARRGSWAI